MDNQQEKMDKITLGEALECPVWEFIWADEPYRKISVEMTYDDLFRIVNFMKKNKGEEQ